MDSPLSPFVSLYLLPLGFLILTKFPSCSSRDNDLYTKCSSSNFTCGSLTATYPFWGASRPSGCGIPELELTCEAESATITIKNVKYKVLGIDPDAHTMRIARQDFLSGLCPSQFLNTSLDPPLIDHLPGYTNITFLYGCWMAPVATPLQLTCAVPGTSYQGGFVTAGNFMAGLCHTSVSFPVRTDILTEILNLTFLQDGIRRGFGVKWNSSGDGFACGDCISSGGVCGYDLRTRMAACYCRDQSNGVKLCPTSTTTDPANSNPNNISCNTCKLSGGRCEFNSSSGAFSCYCSDQSYASICPINPKSQTGSAPITTTIKSEKDSKNASLPIGIGIGGAAIFGIFLGVLFLIFGQRRKQKAAAENQSKELLSQPPINKNKNVHPPPVDLSMSIPPYPYSNSYPKSDPQEGSSYFGLQVFSFTELEEATDNFNPVKELGTGGFGSVYHGILRDGRSVAVKRLFDNSIKREEQFMNEVEILNRLRHRNLVTLYGCTSRRTRELIFVYEYVPNGTVADHIHGEQSKSRFLPWPVRLNIAIETADALAYLHTSDVIHRDVKTNNILLDNNFRVKVADFGLSRLFPNNVTHVSTAPQGTPGYVDPEYYNTYQLTDKSDVYSFGVVLIELISSLPAVDTSRQRLDINLANMAVTKIQSGSISELIDPLLGSDKDNSVRKMATSIAELAFRCLQQERDMRPTMNEVHQALRRIQNENCPTGKCETVVEIGEDDVSLLKKVSPPLSPDSVETDQWISSSTLSSS